MDTDGALDEVDTNTVLEAQVEEGMKKKQRAHYGYV
jgi:hypothetical protein